MPTALRNPPSGFNAPPVVSRVTQATVSSNQFSDMSSEDVRSALNVDKELEAHTPNAAPSKEKDSLEMSGGEPD